MLLNWRRVVSVHGIVTSVCLFKQTEPQPAEINQLIFNQDLSVGPALFHKWVYDRDSQRDSSMLSLATLIGMLR